MAFRVQIRRDPSSKWIVNNPILLNGELGYETNTTFLKIGDGATPWNYLPYWEGGQGPAGPTGATGGLQDLEQTLSLGNQTNGHNINMNADDAIVFDNGSLLHKGSYDEGTGGSGGIELECSAGYRLKWENGALYSKGTGGVTNADLIIKSGSLEVYGVSDVYPVLFASPTDLSSYLKDGPEGVSFNNHAEDGVGRSAVLYLHDGNFSHTLGYSFDRTDSINRMKFGNLSDDDNGNIFVIDEGNSVTYYDNNAHTGKFGINKSTPEVALDVVGNIHLNGQPILAVKYKVYTALLTQEGVSVVDTLVSPGQLTVGVTYTIEAQSPEYINGNFTNVGAPNNSIGTSFVATGNTPTNWGTDIGLSYDDGAPTVKVLENTLGDVWFLYDGVGGYTMNSTGLFTTNKVYRERNARIGASDEDVWLNVEINSVDVIYLRTNDGAGLDFNDALNDTCFEIRVYN